MTHFLNWRTIAQTVLGLMQAACISAQLRVPFTELDASVVGNGFFFPQSHNTVKVPDPYSDQHTLTASQCASLFMSFGRACLDSIHALADFSGFRERKDSVAHSEGCWSMAMLDITYVDFRSDALSTGLLQRENGMFHHADACAASPCLTKDALVLWVDAPHIEARIYRFKISATEWISNYPSMAESVLIDFDDGLGWRALHAEQIYEIHYESELRDRIVRCELHRAGRAVKYAACVLRSDAVLDPCATSTFPFPDFAPWTTDENHPWDLHVSTSQGIAKGRAYTLMSTDGIFDKPFIFVEGIDFGLDRDGHPIHEEHRHGTFGWCEFTSGFQDPDVTDDLEYGYDDLHLMPQLLEQIRQYGYDIVLVDFYDGADYLQKNAAVVEEVIRLCNQHKLGQEALVVAGASMGGVISRFALRDMELHGEEHCARLWVSFDAPHAGAHIPRALQESIKFNLEHGQEQAQLFRDRFLMRPASRQMLDVQVFNDQEEFNDWYGQLREMGYPQHCRRIAISNGLPNGDGLHYAHEPLLDWQCDFTDVHLSKQYLYHEAGDEYNALSLDGFYVLGDFRAPVIGLENIGDELYYWIGGLILGALDVIDIDHDMVFTPAGTINRDYAPGGKRNTVQTLASAISRGVQQLEDQINADFLCGDVQPDQYNRDHAFVLSGSAVGIALEDPYQNLNQYMDEHADENYFDRVMFAHDHNENHTELTASNLAFILDEVVLFDQTPIDTVLTAASLNGGEFNFGRPEYSYLHSIHVHDGGRLLANAYQPTHFNEPGDYLSTDNHFVVSTLDCAPAIVVVDDGGAFEIGDPSEEYRTAQVKLQRDSRMIIGQQGVLRIFEGSSLVVEEGAVLDVLPGGMLEVNNGSIIVRPGGQIHFAHAGTTIVTHELILAGSDARLFLDGGELHIDDNATLAMSTQPETTGYLEVSPGAENVLHMQAYSKFIWNGKSNEDVIMRLTNGAHFQNANWALGEIHLAHGKIDLTYNGAFYTDAYLTARDIHFYASNQWETVSTEVWSWFNTVVIDSCVFEHVRLHTNNSKAIVNHSAFIGIDSGCGAYEGRISVASCSFDGNGLECEALALPSYVGNSSFTHNAFIQDAGEEELTVESCLFTDGDVNCLEKSDGRLNLRCNNVINAQGMRVHRSVINMSSSEGAGFNSFENCPVAIELDEVSDILLVRGYNDFSGCTDFIFAGTVDTLCSEESACTMEFEAHYNQWRDAGTEEELTLYGGVFPPVEDLFNVEAIASTACDGYEMEGGCRVQFLDVSPVKKGECPSSTTEERTLVVSAAQGDSQVARVVSSAQGLMIQGREAIANCSVYDAHGLLVFSRNNIQITQSFSPIAGAPDLAPGIYLVQIEGPSLRSCSRVLVE